MLALNQVPKVTKEQGSRRRAHGTMIKLQKKKFCVFRKRKCIFARKKEKNEQAN
jgi:hypothetical protein